MKLNTVKKVAISLLVTVIILLALKSYSNVLEMSTFHIISETTSRDLYNNNMKATLSDFDTIHHNSATQLYSQSNYTVSTPISDPSAFYNPLELTVLEGFRFPHPKAVNLIDILRHSSWIQDLNSILESWEGQRQLIMVTSNSAYREVLLNWLLSATFLAGVSLQRILVVAHDESMWRLMRDKGIYSVFIPPSSLFPSYVDISMFGKIMMTRISVMCLLNHWRFDVAMIDTDALLLKHPWSLFEQFPESDIIASMGSFPGELSSQWGTSLCVGVILIRSSNQTEMFWKEVGNIQPKLFSDQGRINYGLKAMGVKWHSLMDGSYEAECENGLKVNTLSYSHVCRSNCNRKRSSTYYVWHKPASRDGQSKMRAASSGNIWLLSRQWSLNCGDSMLKQEKWLKCIHA